MRSSMLSYPDRDTLNTPRKPIFTRREHNRNAIKAYNMVSRQHKAYKACPLSNPHNRSSPQTKEIETKIKERKR